MKNSEDISRRTIRDFGQQWKRYTKNDGFYGSAELFQDIISPLIEKNEIKNSLIAEIGSGTGRISLMLAEAGAASVVATEPSDGYIDLVKNIKLSPWSDKIKALRLHGDQLDKVDEYDMIFSVGVLHHIPDPIPVLKAAHKALKPGGKVFVWIYGREGNSLLVALAQPLRALTTRLPDKLLNVLVWIIYLGLRVYCLLCRFCSLPLKDYITKIFWKLAPEKRRLVIFDHLNPAYAKYYTEGEVKNLLNASGFSELRLHNRHGYSWAATGIKPIN